MLNFFNDEFGLLLMIDLSCLMFGYEMNFVIITQRAKPFFFYFFPYRQGGKAKLNYFGPNI
jgi:hypothetical protein